MSGFGPDSTDANDDADNGASPGPRPEDIEERLAREIPTDPSLGELAVRAEALGDTLELARAEPERAGALVPAISHTMASIAPVRGSKGRTYLLGAYESEVFRQGLAAIAGLDVTHLPVDETESLEGVLEVVETVLSKAEDPETCGHAIRAFGVIAAARTDWTARWVTNNWGERHLYRFNERVETALTETADLDRLVSLLQTVAVLASHDRLSVLVETLPQRTLETRASVEEYRVGSWIHVIGRELGYDSPVDPADVWERIEDVPRAFGIYRWLLVAYGGDEIPDLEGGPEAAAVVLQKQRHVGVTTVAAFPDTLVDTGDLIEQLIALGTRDVDGYPGIQKRAVTSLGAIAGSPRLSAAEATRLVEHYESVLDDHDRRVQHPALAGLKQLITSDGIPSHVRLRGVDALSSATENDDAGVRHTALRKLGTMMTPDAAPPADRIRETLEGALDHVDPVVRATAAWELTRSEVESDCTDLARTDVVAPLERALDSDDADVRELAVERSKLLASSTAVPADLRRQAIGVLERAVEVDSTELRADAVKALGTAADTDGQSAKTHRRIFTMLDTALEDATEVRNAAANALCNQARGETTPPDLCNRAIPKLGEVLRDIARFNGGSVSRAILEWVGRAARSGAVSDAAVQALETAFETPNDHDRAQVVRGLEVLLQAESADLSPGQRSHVRDLLLTAARDDGQYTREEAVKGLVTWAKTATSPADGEDEVVTALQSRLDAGGRDVCLNAGEGLRTIATSDRFSEGARVSAAETIAGTLEDDDIRVRVSAALDIVQLSRSPLLTTATLTRAQDVLQSAQHADSPVARLYIPDRLGTLVAEELPIEEHGWIRRLLLTALEDDRREIREAAARGIRDAFVTAPPSSGDTEASFVSDLGDALSPSDPEVTRHLLAGLRSVAANDPERLEPLQADLRGVLTEDVPVHVQITALVVLSLLGGRTAND